MLLSLPVWSLCGRQVQTSLPPTQIKRFKATRVPCINSLSGATLPPPQEQPFELPLQNACLHESVIKAQPEHSGIFITGYNYAEGEVCVYPCLWEEPKV